MTFIHGSRCRHRHAGSIALALAAMLSACSGNCGSQPSASQTSNEGETPAPGQEPSAQEDGDEQAASIGMAPDKPPEIATLEGVPALPFTALSQVETHLFRKSKPSDSEYIEVAPGTILMVDSSGPRKTWRGQEGVFVGVRPDPQTELHAFLPHLEPLEDIEVPAAEELGSLLFGDLSGSDRAFCSRSINRILVPGEGEVRRLVAFARAADDRCRGQLALIELRGSATEVLARTRRARIEALSIHQAIPNDMLFDITEGHHEVGKATGDGPRMTSGRRRVFLRVQKGAFDELLAVDLLLDRVYADRKTQMVAEVEARATEEGLEVEIRGSERQVALDTGAESEQKAWVERYRYADGAMSKLDGTVPAR